METKNMFKALAMVMLMPAMLLTTACSNDDFAVNDNTEIVNQKGFTIPVTINVTRQGDDATMRATYTDNGNGTGSLGFSSGDKLLVKGRDNGFNQFAGILTWQSGGTFSGTITTENTSYTGTADDLLKNASMVRAILLPAGYDSKGFIKVSGSGYLMDITYDWTKAFALTKAEAVEQLSREYAGSYSSGTGFALAPLGFILNFTITGLTPSTKVAVAFTNGTITTSGNVTTDGSGNATFAISTNSTSIGSCTLTVGGNNIALPSTSLTEGKIYNITRSAAPAVLSESFNTNQQIATYDGTHFTITCTDVGDSDGIHIGENNPLTITAKNGETIARVEFQCTIGSFYASQTTVTVGTLNWTTNSATGSIDNVNASTVSMSNSAENWVQIDQITVYYQ